MFRDQDRTRAEIGGSWVGHDLYDATHDTRTAAGAMTLLACRPFGAVCAAELVPDIHETARFESTLGRRERRVTRVLLAAYRHQPAQVGSYCPAFDEREHLVHAQEEDVRRRVERAGGMEPLAELDEDSPHATEQARAFQPQILAVANARPRIAEHPAEYGSSNRMPPQCIGGSLPGTAAENCARVLFGISGAWLPGERANTAQERKRIVVECPRLQLELVDRPIAELLEVRIERGRKLRHVLRRRAGLAHRSL